MWNQFWIFGWEALSKCVAKTERCRILQCFGNSTICSPVYRSPILMMVKSVDMVHWLCHNAEHVNSGFWIFINLTWFVKYGPKSGCTSIRRSIEHAARDSTHFCVKRKIDLVSFTASENVFKNFQYCLEGHKASLTARQSITICLVNYCWHILADVSIFFVFSVSQTMTQRIFLQLNVKRSRGDEFTWIIWFYY